MKLDQWKSDWWPSWGTQQAGGVPVKAEQKESESRDWRFGCFAGKQR